jgi:hypothetical protein
MIAFYGEKKLMCGYINGQRVSFEYSAFGIEIVETTLSNLGACSLADLSGKTLSDLKWREE